MGMLLAAPAGNDILFDEALCEQGRNFCNKMWNAFRLIKGWKSADIQQSSLNSHAIAWMQARIRTDVAEINDLYSKYRLNEALMAVFKLFTDEFSGWYLEMIKPEYDREKNCSKPLDKATLDATLNIFEQLMKVIHPFMPFITEELYQHITERKDGESIMVSTLKLDAPSELDAKLIAIYEQGKQVISGVRAVRQQKNIPTREPLVLEAPQIADGVAVLLSDTIIKMAGLSEIKLVDKKSEGTQSFLVGTDEYAVPLGSLIDADAEIRKAEAEIQRLQGFKTGIEKKLSNERFVQNAPAQVVELERKKLSDAESKIAALQETIKSLKG